MTQTSKNTMTMSKLLNDICHLLHDSSLQKACDVLDWFKPAYQLALNEEFKEPANYHRKQWEFLTIWLALGQAGMLDGTKSGISFGAGREYLLYLLARRVSRLVATDLYNSDTIWKTAHTAADQNAREAVLASAPFNIDESRLDVRNMDMRHVQFPNDCFDFAYSSCVLEHIGDDEDFIRHFQEVRRTLRPGGVYVCTTELLFEAETWRTPNNYRFVPSHLLTLVQEAGLVPEPVWHLSMSHDPLNEPPVESMLDLPDYSRKQFQNRVLVSDGAPFTSCSMILRRAEDVSYQDCDVKGFEASRKWLRSCIDNKTRQMVRAGFKVSPSAGLRADLQESYFGHGDMLRLGANQGKVFPQARFLHTSFLYLVDVECVINVCLWVSQDAPKNASIRFSLWRRPRMVLKDRELIQNHIVSIYQLREKHGRFRFEIKADPKYCYAIGAALNGYTPSKGPNIDVLGTQIWVNAM